MYDIIYRENILKYSISLTITLQKNVIILSYVPNLSIKKLTANLFRNMWNRICKLQTMYIYFKMSYINIKAQEKR